MVFGHAEVDFDSLKLGVGMEGGGSTLCGHGGRGFNSVWAWREGVQLCVGMERWSSTASNWVWAWRGGVRQPRTGCEHAGMESTLSNSPELGLGMQGGGGVRQGEHLERELNSPELGVGMQGGELDSPELGVGMQGMQGGSSTVLNWIWACRGGGGGVRQS